MKNSIHVTCQHFLSGIGRYSFELTEEMRKFSNVQLYKPSKANHADEFYENTYPWIKGYQYRSFRDLHSLILPFYIKNAIKKESENQLFHAHWFLSGLALTYSLKKPFVVTMHDVSLLHITEGASWYQKYYQWAIDRFKKRNIPLIVVSENAKKDAIEYAGYPENLIHVVYNGINFKQFNTLDKIIKKKEYFDIIYTGGLGERKNLKLLLSAFCEIEKKFPYVRLRIAGMYPERTIYPTVALELKLKNVIFEGFIPDEKLRNFYHEGDLLVFPSLYEGFGFAPLEAMACGVPVLSAKGGSLMEVVGEGGDFFNYEVGDLQDKIIYFIENHKYQIELKERGEEWVKKFTWENSVKKTQRIYQTI